LILNIKDICAVLLGWHTEIYWSNLRNRAKFRMAISWTTAEIS